jgi:cardiolipin synthase
MELAWPVLPSVPMPALAGFLGVLVALLATAHIVLTKRNVQARAGWVAVVWFVPFIGTLLYLFLGINRIRRRAVALHRRVSIPLIPLEAQVVPVSGGHLPDSLRAINRVINQVTRRPLLAGNRVTVLGDGPQACAAMIDAIHAAQQSVTLCTYIFDNDEVGSRFVEALTAACARGVAVRVLIDAVGLRYSWFNPVDERLAAAGVRVARFLPPRFLPWHLPYANLRNHRKILVIDGVTGFTGGMNIRAGYLRPLRHPEAIIDLHFQLEGPVVAQLQRSFQEDWLFVSGELLVGQEWFPVLAAVGETLARGISDGPDEDFDRLFWAYLAGIQGAQRSLHILTPYFLPEPEIVSALNGAAMRGIDVNIILPEHSNLPPVDWATAGILDDLIAHGCRVWLTPPPFDHGKLFLVDDAWALIGSGNWDPRSLKLNFEFAVECYDPALGRRLRYVIGDRLAAARELTLDELHARPFLVRLRDGLAGLFTPYL